MAKNIDVEVPAYGFLNYVHGLQNKWAHIGEHGLSSPWAQINNLGGPNILIIYIWYYFLLANLK